MNNFLQLVVSSLCNKLTSEDFTRTIILFPNKRASLFLNDYLLKENPNETMWAPTYMTINEFFRSLSTSTESDPIDTVCRLYKHYKRLTNSSDTLDLFYGWGERLLADFDDLDKNLGDAKKVFKDLVKYEEIGSEDNVSDYLDKEQIKQLERFSKDFSVKKQSVVRKRFKKLWDVMYDLYTSVRADLEKDGLAYEGQLFRQVLEGLQEGTISLPEDIKNIAIVGFNVLDKVEQEFFTELKKKGYRMLFYWDYDSHYCLPNAKLRTGNGATHDLSEAGYFISKNIQRFGNELSPSNFNNIERQQQQITFLSANTEAIQAQYTSEWLKGKSFDRNTAIVLCDENQLQPVLYALPSPNPTIIASDVEKANEKEGSKDKNRNKVNITKGFALTHTVVYAETIIELSTAFHAFGHKQVVISEITETLSQVRRSLREKAVNYGFSTSPGEDKYNSSSAPQVSSLGENFLAENGVENKAEEGKAVTPWKEILHKESCYLIFKTLGRFQDLIKRGRLSAANDNYLSIKAPTLLKLIKQVLSMQTIAFHGEPAMGLQIMGVLETRCLDFENVLMLSVGEGILPQRNSEKSFIPFLIRECHGLTTYLRKNSVYAYYFYRLLQRCKNITLVYNSSTAGTQRGEMSRFMSQMLIDPIFKDRIEHKQLASPPLSSTPEDAELEPPTGDKPICTKFSPSSLNSYLLCHRKFYYEKKGLKMPQRVNGVIDPRDLGTLFHKCSEFLYNQLSCMGTKPINSSDFKTLKNDKQYIADILNQAFNEVDVQRTQIVEDTIRMYLELLFKFEGDIEATRTEQFWLKATEKEVQTTLKVPFNDRLIDITVGGEIDRLDIAEMIGDNGESQPCVRIIDYKTNGKPHPFIDVDSLINDQSNDHEQKYNFQTFLYCYVLTHLTGKYGQRLSAQDLKLKQEINELPVCLALYYIPRMSQKGFNPYLSRKVKGKGKVQIEEPLLDVRVYTNEFEEYLLNLIQEIIDPNNPFNRTENVNTCKYCDFKMLCKRTIWNSSFMHN